MGNYSIKVVEPGGEGGRTVAMPPKPSLRALEEKTEGGVGRAEQNWRDRSRETFGSRVHREQSRGGGGFSELSRKIFRGR